MPILASSFLYTSLKTYKPPVEGYPQKTCGPLFLYGGDSNRKPSRPSYSTISYVYHVSFLCYDRPNFRSLLQNSSSLLRFFDLDMSLKQLRLRNLRSTSLSSVNQMPPLRCLLISATLIIVQIDYLQAKPTRYLCITKATNLCPLVRLIYASSIPPIFVKKPLVKIRKKIFKCRFSFLSLKIRQQHLFFSKLMLFTPIIC